MNFQDLKVVESADFYLGNAFRKASKRINEVNSSIKGKDNLLRSKNKETQRIELIKTNLIDHLMKILKSFPEVDELDVFYQELIKLTLDYVSLKKSLGSLNWATKKIEQFFVMYKRKIKYANDYDNIIKAKKEYIGRVASVMKQINPYLAYIEECRKTMKAYPAIKTSIFTVCIFGFPNVGKSTLLSKLTTAKPEIKDYPFTTKKLNLGYIKEPLAFVQIIDTPGSLDRVEKMNKIELQAYLAVKHLANLLIYVFDPTFEYDLASQKALLENVTKFEKPVILFLSKTDIADKKAIEDFKKSYPDILTTFDEIKATILARAKKHKVAEIKEL